LLLSREGFLEVLGSEAVVDEGLERIDRVCFLGLCSTRSRQPRVRSLCCSARSIRHSPGVIGKVDDPLLTSGPAPPADSDLDGMPDAWETSHGLAPNDATDASKASQPRGYTNLENYVNELADSLVGKN
jgi:hypothetical protein